MYGYVIGSFVRPPVNYVIFYIPYLVHYMTNKILLNLES